jgi:hypothetical protein
MALFGYLGVAMSPLVFILLVVVPALALREWGYYGRGVWHKAARCKERS